MQIFQNLRVWQLAHNSVIQTYVVTRNFPDTEKFGITSQIRRAAASVTANLAEGCGRGSNKDFGRFIQYALGSCCEWENFLLLARDLKYISPECSEQLCRDIIEIRTQLLKLKAKLASRQPASNHAKHLSSS